MRRTGIAGVVAGMLAAAVGVVPAAAEQEQPGSFLEVLDVQVVNLEVVVTDRRGERVSGLRREDFELFVDDQPVAIEYFTEVEDGLAKGAPAGAPGVAGASPGEPVGISYLVFIDDYFSIVTDRDRVLRALADQLDVLRPQDRMAVVAWDGNRLTMLSSWSGSRASLEEAFAAAAKRPAGGLRREVERRSFERDRNLTVRTAFDWRREFGALDLATVHYVNLLEEQVQRATAAATSTLRAFAAPPGRKVAILLSGGWPAQPAAWALAEQPWMADRFARGDQLIAALVDTANLLGYTLYPVDVPGMSRDSAVSAEFMESQPTSPLLQREQEMHHTLARLAGPTGGKALLDGSKLGALTAVRDDTRSYYWLGFTADRQFDGRRHEVRLRTRENGLRLRHRERYEDFSRQAEVTMTVESALLFGAGAPQRAFPVQIGAARRAGLGKVEVPLEMAIPVDRLTFLRVADGWATRLELRVAVLDEHGGTSEIPVVPLSFTLPDRPEPGTALRYSTSMRLRRQPHDMVVSLYDPLTGSMLTSNLEVDLR